jgi:Phage tail protein (Tail_P2_I)
MTSLPMHRLLPPQSTPLERAVVDNAPNWDASAAGLGDIVADRPEAFKPWLAAEWELARFAQYFASTDALLAAGLPWLFERGSAASVRRVLGWLGYDAVTIEEDGPYLHIDLGRVADAAEIARIRDVVAASVPAHIGLYRLHFANDLRPLRLDHGPALDAGLLDDDSGVGVDDVKASFGMRHTGEVGKPNHAVLALGHIAGRCVSLTYDDRMLLDVWRLDSRVMADAYSGVGALFSGTCAAPVRGEPLLAFGEGTTHLVSTRGQALPMLGGHFAHTALLPTAGLPKRTWHAPWHGPWRAAIPSYRYEET